MTDTLRDMEIWHERARPAPTAANFSVQLGCHFEEICEMLECIDISAKSNGDILAAYEALSALAYVLKSGKSTAKLFAGERTDFLDSLADQVVTAVGVAHCAGMDMTEACKRVNKSNWSKFVDGQPVFSQKIRKWAARDVEKWLEAQRRKWQR